MEMTTIMFKWRRALSHEGVMSTNLYFSRMHESSYYLKQTLRPYYIVVISNYNTINEFSLGTSTYDMSSAVWLVIFIYKENGTDYCHNPPGNIFHLRFNTEMMVHCGTENILREWYSIDTNQIEINDIATWSSERGIIKMVPDFIYERRNNLKGIIMRAVIGSTFINLQEDGELGSTILMPKKNRVAIYKYLFKEGIMIAKNYQAIKYFELETISNLEVIKAVQFFKTRSYFTEKCAWSKISKPRPRSQASRPTKDDVGYR
ncbi:hypothetical protein HZH66_013652 [Vespula vulgaris]|uniref:Plectin/eS10 N-terminal domain-containing protein n=1 Tax=Vespula vulgaris TaxID=7454 RepID=A0A834MRT6_VESVU|nr:hypothetical protein HZH66_013652 [Vespula vulgaris]